MGTAQAQTAGDDRENCVDSTEHRRVAGGGGEQPTAQDAKVTIQLYTERLV